MIRFWYLVFFSGIMSFVISCNQHGKTALQPEIMACDSAVVMYYNTAGDPRFFRMVKNYDKDFIISVHNAVNDKVIAAKESCITQGKIYFYGIKGAVYVVYFSRLEDCMTLSLIKTGEKYFAAMPKEVKQVLDELEKSAGTPGQE